MGILQTNNGESIEDPTSTLKINIDLKKPVKPQLKQLLSWSLNDIREIYAPYRKRKSSPILSRSEFLRFIRMSRMTSFYIHNHLVRNNQPIIAFEIMALLILTSHTSINYKIQFMFNVFDLCSLKSLQFSQLILLFKSLIRGFSFLTNQQPPTNSLLEKYAQTMFSRADINNDQNLQLSEILSWFLGNQEAKQFFDQFAPQISGKEQYFIFNSFTPYSPHQVELLFHRVNKVYRKEKLIQDDFTILNTSNHHDHILDGRNRNSKHQILAPIMTHGGSEWRLKQRVSGYDGIAKKQTDHRFQNIIIIKGKTITKKEVFDLREYFDKITNGKKEMYIQDFIESFNQEKYNHMKSVAASLYNFLDKNQSGKVTFFDLILKLYPNLTCKHIKIITNWSHDYNRIFNLETKIKDTRNTDDPKKRNLPRNCLPRFKEIFGLFDKENKGFVTFDNLKTVLGDVCNERELVELFEESDQNKDGKLALHEFVHVLLPPDLDIEGLR